MFGPRLPIAGVEVCPWKARPLLGTLDDFVDLELPCEHTDDKGTVPPFDSLLTREVRARVSLPQERFHLHHKHRSHERPGRRGSQILAARHRLRGLDRHAARGIARHLARGETARDAGQRSTLDPRGHDAAGHRRKCDPIQRGAGRDYLRSARLHRREWRRGHAAVGCERCRGQGDQRARSAELLFAACDRVRSQLLAPARALRAEIQLWDIYPFGYPAEQLDAVRMPCSQISSPRCGWTAFACMTPRTPGRGRSTSQRAAFRALRVIDPGPTAHFARAGTTRSSSTSPHAKGRFGWRGCLHFHCALPEPPVVGFRARGSAWQRRRPPPRSVR